MSNDVKREVMKYDVVIVGAGPAGLATALKLKQLNKSLSICILEKGAEVGAHILSGNVFETRALDELIPDRKVKDAPIKTKVTKEQFLFLSQNSSFSWPTTRTCKSSLIFIAAVMLFKVDDCILLLLCSANNKIDIKLL